ncbi:MAG: HIT domain-containing protein [Planctomycetota bacterium]|nr:HIT domain-containing protein [Planctomycetota bacterium]
MEHLWAPWRMEFIRREKRPGCVFCALPAERDRLRENLVLHVGRVSFVVLNRYPYTCGHLLVIPLRHTADFLSLTPEENSEAAQLLQDSMRILQEGYRPEGFNLGMNLGQCAGTGIREHLHHHLIPRWVGDSNFLPIVGGARSMPQLLLESYDLLRPHFRRLEASGGIAPGGHQEIENDVAAAGTAGSDGERTAASPGAASPGAAEEDGGDS